MKAITSVRIWPVFAVTWLLSQLLVAEDRAARQQIEFFEKRIRPVLVEHCYECHSERSTMPKGGLRLDSRETIRSSGDNGPVLIPGRPQDSLLIEAVRYQSIEMPPKGKLPQSVISDLVKWVEMGAPDPRDGKRGALPEKRPINQRDHWAFRLVVEPQRPQVLDVIWPLSDADYYLLARLESEGLSPVQDADRYAWLRRVHLDLTGLPPKVAEIREFQQDASPLAYARVVDRLLASRAFGERWARHWLDLVGYADQIGTSNNLFAEHAWRYRDYVIDAFNEDKPFSRFIREQIAGDLLEYESVQQRAAGICATGFLVLGDLEVVEADKAKLKVDIVDQQVVKVSRAFLGMTVGCARCHDHKFDPISQWDYYAIAGFFHSTDSVFKTERGVWSDVLASPLPETGAQRARRVEQTKLHVKEIAVHKAERDRAAERQRTLDTLIEKSADAKLLQQREQLTKRIGQLDTIIEHAEFFTPSVPRAYGVQDSEHPANMRVTIRGNPRALGDEVARGFLQLLSTQPPVIPATESGRRQLADWIADDDNPLTARVAVNRIWQKLFGFGLVRSVDYFGVRGAAPSHPKLLDHLASKFVQQNWSRKRLIRSLVLSRAYRMSSAHNAHAFRVDPDNRLLWRMNRLRLDAEALRDGLLTVSGQLHPAAGGPAIPLEYPENVANIDPKNVNPPSFRLSKWRPVQEFQRTIYLPVIRSGPQPGPGELRNMFDFTQPATFSGQRSTTAVPTQALFLLNSPFVKRQASHLAARITQSAAGDVARIELLWLCALNRSVTEEEVREAAEFLTSNGSDGWIELCHAILVSNEFIMRL